MLIFVGVTSIVVRIVPQSEWKGPGNEVCLKVIRTQGVYVRIWINVLEFKNEISLIISFKFIFQILS